MTLQAPAPVSADDRRRMLHEWNRPLLPRDGALTVHGRFSEQVATHSARVAVAGTASEATTIAWRYSELDAHADRMARRLQALGVAPGDAVGVMLERSPMAVAALLGILKTGAAYVPV